MLQCSALQMEKSNAQTPNIPVALCRKGSEDYHGSHSE